MRSFLGIAAAIALVSPAEALAQTHASDVPHCQSPVGSVTILPAKTQWWTQYGLGSPDDLIKLMAARSNCLRVVDRGAGLSERGLERNLATSGELQHGSNVGAGQIKAADFALIPDIANANANAGGSAAGLGGLLGGRAGALFGGIRTQRSNAHVLLELVNVRTTEQEYIAEGVAEKTNVSFTGGGFGGALGGIGGGYSNTDIGQVIASAYLSAFTDLVSHLQGMSVGSAKADAPIQTYMARQAIQMRARPSTSAPVVRSFNAGESVFPTGQKNGVWWEVDDENGNRGWVSSVMITAK